MGRIITGSMKCLATRCRRAGLSTARSASAKHDSVDGDFFGSIEQNAASIAPWSTRSIRPSTAVYLSGSCRLE